MKLLKELQNKIREDIPRLLDIKSGLLVINGEDFIYHVDHLYEYRDELTVYYHLECPKPDRHEVQMEDTLNLFKKSFKVLGHPIKLSDVTKWINSKEEKVNDDFALSYYIMTAVEMWEGDYLSEQSEELLSLLYRLV